jgi:hypothetical protein
MLDPITILAALGPLAVKLGDSLINKYVVPDTYKPANMGEVIQLKELDLKLFDSMNNAGGTAPTYPWVDAVVKLMRPSVAIVTIATWAYCHMANAQCGPEVDNFAAAIGFYLFGDRTLFYAAKK